MVQFKSFLAFTLAAIAIALGLVQVSLAKKVTVAPPEPTRGSYQSTGALKLPDGEHEPRPSEAEQREAKRNSFSHSMMVGGRLAMELIKAEVAGYLPKRKDKVRQSYIHDERRV